MEKFGKFCFGFISLIILMFTNAFVVSKLWLWFIIPVFNMQPLQIVEAIGLTLIIRYFTLDYEKLAKEESVGEKIFNFFKVILLQLIVLGIGYIVSFFV